MSRWIIFCVLFLLEVGCQGSGVLSRDIVSETTETLDSGDVFERAETSITEDFSIAYTYRERAFQDIARVKVIKRDSPLGEDKVIATLGEGTPSCEFGCVVSPDLRFVAVMSKDARDPLNTTLSLYSVEDAGKIVKTDFSAGKVAFARFSATSLFFTRSVPCSGLGATNCFEVYRLNPDTLEQNMITVLPPVSEGISLLSKGDFVVGEDGESLVFPLQAGSGIAFLVWDGKGISPLLGPLCSSDCTFLLSQSGFETPLMLSSDRRTIVFSGVYNDKELRLYKADLGTFVFSYRLFLKVPYNYAQNACENRAQWQFTEIWGPILFSKDNKDVFFIGAHSCKDNQIKLWTNIYKMPLSAIEGGAMVREEEILNITKNPQGYTASATSITTFDVSPEGGYIGFIGTPIIGSDGALLPTVQGGRHEKDREVFVISTDGLHAPLQLTNDVGWMAQWLVLGKP
jgi:WD40 repeat protein